MTLKTWFPEVPFRPFVVPYVRFHFLSSGPLSAPPPLLEKYRYTLVSALSALHAISDIPLRIRMSMLP
jgi:hypothetical protein